MNSLVLQDLYLAYPGADAPVLNGLSMTLALGQIACLLGPSGCGKSTALRAIAGFEPLQAGSITLGGRVLSGPGVHLAPERRGVGMLFQEIALFPHLSAERNVAFGLRHLPRAQRRARVHELLALVGLQHCATRMPHQMSGGQQQRIALARALAPAPQLLLLDEPFSGLDTPTRRQLAGDVRAILRQAGQTALMVTHDAQEAGQMADWIGVFGQGRFTQWRAAAH